MTDRLKELGDKIGLAFQQRAEAFASISRIVKIGMIAVASAVVAVAQLMTVPFSTWQVVGITGAVTALVGALFVGLTEHDASAQLEAARSAIEEAKSERRNNEDMLDDFVALQSDLDRALAIYSAMHAMRGVVEQALGSEQRDEIAIIRLLMKACKRPLPIALGCEQSDQWTICVYKAETNGDTHKTSLRCVEHNRAIPCEVSEARRWPEGVGVGGYAYANSREIVVPDMADDALGSIFEMTPQLAKDYDRERYRSFAAVPILVDRDEKPWGVVIGTSDRPDHFLSDDGFRTVEPIRALAGMIALAVSTSRMPIRPFSDAEKVVNKVLDTRNPAT